MIVENMDSVTTNRISVSVTMDMSRTMEYVHIVEMEFLTMKKNVTLQLKDRQNSSVILSHVTVRKDIILSQLMELQHVLLTPVEIELFISMKSVMVDLDVNIVDVTHKQNHI